MQKKLGGKLATIMVGYFRYALQLWPMFVGFLAFDIFVWIVAALFKVHMSSPPMFLLVPMILVPSGMPIGDMYNPARQTAHPEGTERAKVLGESVGIEAFPVLVIPGTGLKTKKTAFWKDSKIFLTKALADSFTPAMIDFVLAHEIAHVVKLREYQQTGAKMPGWKIVLIFGSMACAFTLLRLEIYWVYRFLVPVVGIGLIVLLTGIHKAPIHASPDLELWCDRKAVEITGDAESAVLALEAICDGQSAKSAKWSGYPAPETRLAQIRKMIEERDLVLVE